MCLSKDCNKSRLVMRNAFCNLVDIRRGIFAEVMDTGRAANYRRLRQETKADVRQPSTAKRTNGLGSGMAMIRCTFS